MNKKSSESHSGRNDNKAHLALVASTLIYGLFYVAVKILVNEISPWETFTLRLLLATPLLFVIEKLFFNCRIQSRSDFFKITGLGLLGITIVQATIMVGLKYTSVFHTGFIVGTAPLMTLLFSVMLKQETLTLSKGIGIVIAFAGLLLLLFSSNSEGSHLPEGYLIGDIIVFLNIVGWSLFLVLSRPLLQRYPAFSLTSYAFLFSSLLTLPVMLLLLHKIPGAELSVTGWKWMAFVVLFATIITYFLNYYALSKLTASLVAIYVFLQPIFTAFFGYLILHEPVTLIMLSEGFVILVGVSIATESYRSIIAWLFQATWKRFCRRDNKVARL